MPRMYLIGQMRCMTLCSHREYDAKSIPSPAIQAGVWILGMDTHARGEPVPLCYIGLILTLVLYISRGRGQSQ